MARPSWTRLTVLLFVSVLFGMIYWQRSFQREQDLHEKNRAIEQQRREIEDASENLGEELEDVRDRLKDMKKHKKTVLQKLKETEKLISELKSSESESQAKAEVAVDSAAQQSAPEDAQAVAPVQPRFNSIPETAGKYDPQEDYDFKDTAIVTLATGNNAARGVIALVQSLRDVGTRAQDIVVMLSQGGNGSPECHDPQWKKERGRENVHCSGASTIAEEIISPQYVQTLTNKLGATVMVVPEIPSTQYTAGIPGGRSTFW